MEPGPEYGRMMVPAVDDGLPKVLVVSPEEPEDELEDEPDEKDDPAVLDEPDEPEDD